MSGRFSVNTARSSDCLRDHFLLAMPGLSEGIFSQSITYICEHGESGAMGIVINQPLDLRVAEIFEHLEITTRRDFSDCTGDGRWPGTDRSRVCAAPQLPANWEASLKVTPEITLTTSCDILRAIANNEGPADHLIALGYAGWSAGQLEQELAKTAGSPCPPTAISFSAPRPNSAWAAAAALLGIDMNLISGEAGHA